MAFEHSQLDRWVADGISPKPRTLLLDQGLPQISSSQPLQLVIHDNPGKHSGGNAHHHSNRSPTIVRIITIRVTTIFGFDEESGVGHYGNIVHPSSVGKRNTVRT